MRALIALLALAVLSCPAHAAKKKDKDLLATVNGTAIKKPEIADRLWALYATDALNQRVDEVLVEQAAAAWEKGAAQPVKEALEKAVDERVARVRSRFPDEASFRESLKRTGSSPEELRRLTRAQILREELVLQAMSLSVSTQEARAFFDANKDQLGARESVHLRHILVGTEGQARDMLVALRVGADFSKLASEISLDTGLKERGGDLGFIPRGMLQPDIEKAVFALKPGEVSEVVKSPLGYHLFKAEERTEARPAVYEELQAGILQTLLAQKVAQAWPLYLKNLRDAAKIVPAEGVSAAP